MISICWKRNVLSALVASGIVFSCLSCEKDSTIGPSDKNPVNTKLIVNLSGMTTNVGQRAMFDVRGLGSSLVARAILDPLMTATDTFELPGAIPPAATDSLCFWTDVNANHQYDAPPVDEAWRMVIPANGVVNFTHTTTYADIDSLPGSFNLVMNFAADFGTHASGKLVEIRVADSASGQTVGLYRKGVYASGAQQIIIPGILRGNTAYRIDFYADQNGNTTYDPPPTDHAWRLFGRTASDQLSIDFVTSTNYTDIKF